MLTYYCLTHSLLIALRFRFLSNFFPVSHCLVLYYVYIYIYIYMYVYIYIYIYIYIVFASSLSAVYTGQKSVYKPFST